MRPTVTIIILTILCIIGDSITAVNVGSIRDASVMMTVASNLTMNASTCQECVCAMLISTTNPSILSFNCYTMDVTHVVCQMFTDISYLISSVAQVQSNTNSTFYFRQLPPSNPLEMATTEGSSQPTSSQPTTILTTETESQLTTITRPGDSIIGLYNTTAGGSTGGKNGNYATLVQYPPQAIDNSTATKYLNFGTTGGYNTVAPQPGAGTGFYVTPAISNASIAISILFATADDCPNRDPITITLEGTNVDALDDGSSWTMIYNGPTGIDPFADPGRQYYVAPQNFSNTVAYKSYRLLVTSQRGSDWAVQYSEVHIIGYI